MNLQIPSVYLPRSKTMYLRKYLLNSEYKRTKVIDYNTTMRRSMNSYATLLLLVLLQALPVESGEYCYNDYFQRTYCTSGCCYSSGDGCCVKGLEGGIIAAIVVGSLAGLGSIIGFIVCCCVAANNSSRRTAALNQPVSTTMQTHMVTNAAYGYGQSAIPGPNGPPGYGYAFVAQPPAYPQHDYVPQGSAQPAFQPPPQQTPQPPPQPPVTATNY